MPVIIPIIPFINHRKRAAATTAVVVPLALVSAVYEGAVPRIILGFNQPLDLNALDAPTITVNDPVGYGVKYYAFNGPNMIDASTFWLELVEDGPATGSATTMSANAFNGIAALDPAGGEWAGVTDLELPFP